jgi:hypothetical protein
VTTDGPFVETKEHLGRFWIIETDDLDAARAGAPNSLSPVGAQSR